MGGALDAFRELALPSVRLVRGRGVSGIGGLPRLASGTAWPRRNGAPLTLLAQLALDDLPEASAPEWLPRAGSLAFFYDYDEMPWDGEAVVLFGPHPLVELPVAQEPVDLAPDLVIRRTSVEFVPGFTLPASDSELVRSLALSGDQLDRMDDLRVEGQPVHRLFGYPDAIQDPLVDRGRLVDLLLQLDTDEDAGLEFGDDGRLFFLVPAHGGLEERLAGVSAVLQEG